MPSKSYTGYSAALIAVSGAGLLSVDASNSSLPAELQADHRRDIRGFAGHRKHGHERNQMQMRLFCTSRSAQWPSADG
jgi:hypothetical protein